MLKSKFVLMAKEKFDPDRLKGFTAQDTKLVANKLRRFSPGTTHLVSDWDRTLTATNQHIDITSWGVVQNLLPPEALAKDKKLDEKFLPKERSGKLTIEEAAKWWHTSLKLHVKYGTNIHDMERAVKDIGLHPREGSVALFEACKLTDTPTIILSAGIRNVIEWITGKYGMEATVILATHLLINDEGTIIGWDDATRIHFFNKHEAGHKELSLIRQKRPNAILLGDTIEDAGMVSGKEDVIRIRVCDSHSCKTEADREDFKKASFAAGYDLIVKDSLGPVVGLIKWLSEKH